MSPWRLAGTSRPSHTTPPDSSVPPSNLVVQATDDTGRIRAEGVVPHGASPTQALRGLGFKAVRVTGAAWRGKQFVLTYRTHPASWRGRSLFDRPQRAHTLPEGVKAVVRQRIAAYCVVTSERGFLLTSLSAATGHPGLWILPGGGLEPGEEPTRGVMREIWEETGQRVPAVELIDVFSGHRVGTRADGTYEDFHAVRLIYRAFCETPSEPIVHDVGGSTESAIWTNGRPDAMPIGLPPGQTLAAWAEDAISAAARLSMKERGIKDATPE